MKQKAIHRSNNKILSIFRSEFLLKERFWNVLSSFSGSSRHASQSNTFLHLIGFKMYFLKLRLSLKRGLYALPESNIISEKINIVLPKLKL